MKSVRRRGETNSYSDAGRSRRLYRRLDGKAKAESLLPSELLALFDRAMRAIWQRIRLPLGEITLDAIANRVHQIAQDKYPFLASLRRDSTGISGEPLAAQMAPPVPATQVREGLRFFLVEFLHVVGTVTGEILTPSLRSELSKLTLESAGGGGGTRLQTPDRWPPSRA